MKKHKNEDLCYKWFPIIFSGFDDIAKILVENGADVGVKDMEGSTLLHLAVESGACKKLH